MTAVRQFLALVAIGSLNGCGFIFGRPMTEDDFVEASEKCGLDGARLIGGNFLKGTPSIIEAPKGVKPSEWDGKLECVSKLFGGDGVSKPTSNSFVIRFSS